MVRMCVCVRVCNKVMYVTNVLISYQNHKIYITVVRNKYTLGYGINIYNEFSGVVKIKCIIRGVV